MFVLCRKKVINISLGYNSSYFNFCYIIIIYNSPCAPRPFMNGPFFSVSMHV